METRHWIIKGQVQGVGFRFFTLKIAKQLQLKGWVRNLTTGEVEVLAQGNEHELNELNHWLHQGSPAAKVTKVSSKIVPNQHLSPFETKPTHDHPQKF